MALERNGRTLITGGCGFIGSHFVEHHLRTNATREVVNLDLLTYAGNANNLLAVVSDPRYRFVHGDIRDPDAVARALAGCDVVVHFAAESHVDRSLLDAAPFVSTNVQGTAVLLAAAREQGVRCFLQVSTDEVYGDIPAPARSVESDPLRPRSLYAASKAGAELLCNAFRETYGLPVVIARCSNGYGPRQYPEKIIPLFVTNALAGRKLPVYGDGQQQRDWTHVTDICNALQFLLEHGEPGEVYNVTAQNVRPNLEVARTLLAILRLPESLIEHVADRTGHDRRYALDGARLRGLGWQPVQDWGDAFARTVHWYVEHRSWWEELRNAGFNQYYERQYAGRGNG